MNREHHIQMIYKGTALPAALPQHSDTDLPVWEAPAKNSTPQSDT